MTNMNVTNTNLIHSDRLNEQSDRLNAQSDRLGIQDLNDYDEQAGSLKKSVRFAKEDPEKSMVKNKNTASTEKIDDLFPPKKKTKISKKSNAVIANHTITG